MYLFTRGRRDDRNCIFRTRKSAHPSFSVHFQIEYSQLSTNLHSLTLSDTVWFYSDHEYVADENNKLFPSTLPDCSWQFCWLHSATHFWYENPFWLNDGLVYWRMRHLASMSYFAISIRAWHGSYIWEIVFAGLKTLIRVIYIFVYLSFFWWRQSTCTDEEYIHSTW